MTMRNGTAKGFTTPELIITLVVVAVLGTAAYLFSSSSAKTQQITPEPTNAPTTLTITRSNKVNASASGFTIKINNTKTANAILADINKLPFASKGLVNCPNDTGDTYTLHFTEPVETYVADYGGCDLVVTSGGKSRVATGQYGKIFWADIYKATSRPL